MTLNVLQLTNDQVDTLQDLAANGLPYVIATHEQCCIAEVAQYLQHHTDFDGMVAIIENYRAVIQQAEELKALICNE